MGVLGGAAGDTGEGSGGESTTIDLSTVTKDQLLETLPEDLRGAPVFQNLKDENPLVELATQFHHAQKLIGTDRLPAPTDKWGDDEWKDFYGKIGRPEEATAYELPEGFKEETLAKEGIDLFKQKAHEAGLSQKQYQELLGWYAGVAEAETTATKEQLEQRAAEQQKVLTTTFGDNLPKVLESANRGLLELKDEGLIELFKTNPALANDPSILNLFSKIDKLNAEERIRTGTHSGVGDLNSSTDVEAAIENFNNKHAELLRAVPQNLNPADRAKREDIIKERMKLYQAKAELSG